MSEKKAEKDPQIIYQIREFLDGLNNSGGEPLETLSPASVTGHNSN